MKESESQQSISLSYSDHSIRFVLVSCLKLRNQVSKNSAEGSGLGLYICRELARLMRGHVCCTSQLGVGSTFTFAVPYESCGKIASSGSASNREAAPSDIQSTIERRMILVAEDNRVNQMVISNMLSKLGCTFDIVSDGRAALDLFQQVRFVRLTRLLTRRATTSWS
jgi:hypothetical protein